VSDNVFLGNISRFSSSETYIPDDTDRFACEAGGSAGCPAYDVEDEKVDSRKDMSDKTRVLVRLRHRAPLIPATFDGESLRFEHEVKKPACGQSAVLYDGEICLGGGIIN